MGGITNDPIKGFLKGPGRVAGYLRDGLPRGGGHGLLQALFCAFRLTLALLVVSSGTWQRATADSSPDVTAKIETVRAGTGIVEAMGRLRADGFLHGHAIDWQGLAKFYQDRDRGIWVSATGYSALGTRLVRQIADAETAGMEVPPEARRAIDALSIQAVSEDLANAEAVLSIIYVFLANDRDAFWAEPSPADVVLLNIAARNDAGRLIAEELPASPMFWRLRGTIPGLLRNFLDGSWPIVSVRSDLRLGSRGPDVSSIRARLAYGGDMIGSSPAPDLFDNTLDRAVRSFQGRHGLPETGIVDHRTVEELNVSAEARLKSALLNLDRLRHLLPQWQERIVFVNIPSFELRVLGNGVTTFRSKTVVGRLDRRTPLLQSEIFRIKVNPDWTVPHRIAVADLIPKEVQSSGYLKKNGFQVYTASDERVALDGIDWRAIQHSGEFPFRLRQKPGNANELGPVKFDFQNDYAVFIHGTSEPELFAEDRRFFSHGCIRVDDPIGLAEHLLGDQARWNRAELEKLVATQHTTYIKVARSVPVVITYLTAWADEAGILNFRPDSYGLDHPGELPPAIKPYPVVARQ